ncbi:DUF6531 domain-containing protein [Paraburkholderia fungorum]
MNKNPYRGSAFMLVRIITTLVLLLVAFGVRAESGDAICFGLYPKSGAIQGASNCPLIASSNTPVGMGTYRCTAELQTVKRWCGAPPDLAQSETSCPIADPVYPDSGSTTVTENDFASGDEIPLLFSRTYRSRTLIKPDSGFGSLWFHNWQRQLGLTKVNSNPPQLTAYRENGDAITFSKSSGGWHAVNGKLFALSQGPSTWTLTDLTTATTESYSLQGVLLSVRIHGGQVITLSYSDANTPHDVAPAAGLLIAITEHAPNTNPYVDVTLHLSYDAKWRIVQMTEPMGAITQYGYDDYNNLTSVTWPDGNIRRYAYADPRFTSALTDVIDETGARINTWTYDAQGRATAASHPDTSRNVWFAYGNNGTLVNHDQKSLMLNYSAVGNGMRPTSTSSAAGTTATTWDTAGNLLSQTGVSGLSRSAAYDDANRPTRVTHVGLAGTTVTSVRYADGFSLRPSIIASPGWIRAFVYDAQDNLTGLSEWTTTDSTGASGFDALADGNQKISYGLTYDAQNQLNYAQVYEDGKLTNEWTAMRGGTGNIRQINNRTTGSYYRVTVYDRAHRAISIDVPGGSANPTYDSRGRIKSFLYNESATTLNGNVSRALNLGFGYSPDGRLVSRTGTVSTNRGPDIAISSDEIDQWVTNWNSGVSPVGPPTNLLGWVSALKATTEPGLVPVLSPWEAMFAASRFAWTIYLIASKGPTALLVENLKPELEAKKCADVPPQLTTEKMSGMLRDAASGKGNFTLGKATAEDAQTLGEAWVGPGARETSDGSGMVSVNGLRVYRYPSSKPNSPYANTGIQANFESKMTPTGRPYANGHLNIAP